MTLAINIMDGSGLNNTAIPKVPTKRGYINSELDYQNGGIVTA